MGRLAGELLLDVVRGFCPDAFLLLEVEAGAEAFLVPEPGVLPTFEPFDAFVGEELSPLLVPGLDGVETNVGIGGSIVS